MGGHSPDDLGLTFSSMFPPHITPSRHNDKDISIAVERQLSDNRTTKGPSPTTDWTLSDIHHEDQHTTLCKMMVLERKCTDRAKALIFQNGYSKSSREALRLFPSPAEDVAPLCCQ
ncbi:hypothetical protein KUCAC02_012410 [Chaenocephalus aceratus]|uniref:Uncharacterized protein n=1 Tax=Chaenocephalus aceratus TaxID=36190 RepID=A0ACB9XCE0_CHAAC|nr:hypothetical protein KUCAC02_012410 [Chaenocephalus aceratus]